MGHNEVFAGDLLSVVIVNADDVAVLSEVKVAFDAISALLPSELEGGKGVLGGISRGSAMGDNEEGDNEFDHDVGAEARGGFW